MLGAHSPKAAVLSVAMLLIQGCASWSQAPYTVVIRGAGDRTDQPAVALNTVAPELYVYAALSTNVYRPATSEQASRPTTTAEIAAACAPKSKRPMPIGIAWKQRKPFLPDDEKLDEEANLRVELWQHTNADSKIDELVVVFRGTEPKHGKDWWSNLRWFGRADGEDHYTLTAGRVAREVQSQIASDFGAARVASDFKLTTTGHSLGGGLAQHLAYAYLAPDNSSVKPSHVYAFNSSPVTGWFSVDNELRTRNALGLKIDRVYEHGEFLWYLRELIAVVVPPSAGNPAISGVRLNVKSSPNPFSNHSMPLMACALAKSAFPNTANLDLQPLEADDSTVDED